MSKPIRVLIVDDSKAMCAFLTEVMSSDPDLDVVGHALDPYQARTLIKTLHPDVLTLDVEMPKMDGVTFLRNIMRLRPMPVVMLSSLTTAGAEVTLDALAIGAVDFMVKRHPKSKEELAAYEVAIIERVKNAGTVNVEVKSAQAATSRTPSAESARFTKSMSSKPSAGTSASRIVALGASTGGTEALREVLENFYAPDVAVVLVQHMPQRFMAPFAQRLDSFSRFNVVEAQNLVPLKGGTVYVAPGEKHLTVRQRDGDLRTRLTDDPPCSGHRPSVDVLFDSVATTAGASAVGVLLTGMGNDGAVGLLNMKEAGAMTFVQDKQSSAVWGMPGSAVRLGAAEAQLPLGAIGPTLQQMFSGASSQSAAG